MKNKMPLSYVAAEVDKLYERVFDKDDIEGINKHCDFIKSFINACGWSEEQYDDYVAGYEPAEELILS